MEPRGFAFVRFLERGDAEEAMREMEGREVDGREVRIQADRQHPRPRLPPDQNS